MKAFLIPDQWPRTGTFSASATGFIVKVVVDDVPYQLAINESCCGIDIPCMVEIKTDLMYGRTYEVKF